MSSSRIISPACGECRARKIKCDLQKPSCVRCVKSGRQCPGYRDQLALWFRDESQTVAQRTKANTHPSTSTGRRTQRSLMEEELDKILASNELAQRGELFLLPIDLFMVDVQDRATCYFFEVFDWAGISTLIDGSFDYKIDSLNAPVGEQALLAGITAVGKASLANLHGSSTLRESASDDYGTTLSLVNAAICDSVQMKENSTLIAIFLLSIFEIVAGQGKKSIDNWINHIIGASRLLESMEAANLAKISSPEMFYCLRSAIVTCCICRKVPVPLIIIRLSGQVALSTRDPLSAALRDLTEIMARLARTRQKIDSGELNESQNILDELYSIDSELEEWSSTISPSCYYDSIATKQPFQLTPSISLSPHSAYCHRYTKVWIAHMWNESRTTKFQVYDMILKYSRPLATSTEETPGFRDTKARCLQIRERMLQLSDDICASVPYILGIMNQERREIQQPAVRNSCGAFLLLWPLTVAAFIHPLSSPTSQFVFSCFDLISRYMGIRQATVFRDWVISGSDQYTTKFDQY